MKLQLGGWVALGDHPTSVGSRTRDSPMGCGSAALGSGIHDVEFRVAAQIAVFRKVQMRICDS
jgi:hypothetical protein